MNTESDHESIIITKENRPNNQDALRNREIYHPFKFHVHFPKRKDIQRRAHELERKLLRRK